MLAYMTLIPTAEVVLVDTVIPGGVRRRNQLTEATGRAESISVIG